MNIKNNYRCCGFKSKDLKDECGYKPQTEVKDLCYDSINDEINK